MAESDLKKICICKFVNTILLTVHRIDAWSAGKWPHKPVQRTEPRDSRSSGCPWRGSASWRWSTCSSTCRRRPTRRSMPPSTSSRNPVGQHCMTKLVYFWVLGKAGTRLEDIYYRLRAVVASPIKVELFPWAGTGLGSLLGPHNIIQKPGSD